MHAANKTTGDSEIMFNGQKRQKCSWACRNCTLRSSLHRIDKPVHSRRYTLQSSLACNRAASSVHSPCTSFCPDCRVPLPPGSGKPFPRPEGPFAIKDGALGVSSFSPAELGNCTSVCWTLGALVADAACAIRMLTHAQTSDRMTNSALCTTQLT